MTDGRKARLVGMVCFFSVAFLFACDDYAPLGYNFTCGNGVVETGETCDTGIAAGQTGACPTSCTPPDSCTTSTLQNGGTCIASCQNTPIAPCCGNGVKETGETCDIGIAAGQPDACPTSCNDNNACTTDILTGAAATCDAVCTHQAVTACTNDDGCCPNGCTGANDNDCAKCGNGVVDPLETCDTAIAAGHPGACPTTCPDDGNSCTNDSVQYAGTCAAACIHPAITACVGGDGCCPATCTHGNDSDCPDCVDQTGTWISRVTTTGTITAPAPIGTLTKATIDVVQRIYTSKSGGNLNFHFQICSLSTTNTAGIPFSTDYSPAVLATFDATASQSDQCVQAGGAFTVPPFIINSGWGGVIPTTNTCPAPPSALIDPYPYSPGTLPTSCSGAVDSDGDGVYGVTLRTHLFGGALNIWAFAGLTMNISLNNMVMTNANTNTGTSSFPTTGYIFGSDSGATGNLNVVPSSDAVPVTAIKLTGDVPCATVLTHCTGAVCVP